MPAPYNVLFLCTGNASRSIMAEAILARKGAPNFIAYSAGSHPAGVIHACALRQIERAGLSAGGMRSKSWNEFGAPCSPQMDFVFTLCDSAAQEVCPVWPGQPVTAHWGLPDPGLVGNTPEQLERAFQDAFVTLDRRIGLFLALPLASLERLAVEREVRRIGRS
jgi:arsenate reductase (thioredoxin)